MPTHIHRSMFVLPLAAIVLFVAVLIPIRSARADVTFVVDNVTDDAGLSACTLAPGDCSLRGAIAAANAAAGADTIEFLIPAAQCPGGICPITLTEGQLEITEAVTIDATTQPQNSAPQANVCAAATEPSHMRIEVITAPTVGDGIGFYLNDAEASVIKGFALGTDHAGGFDGLVKVRDGSGHHIACNHFGFDAAGSAALGSAEPGVHIDFEGVASDIVVGTNGDGVDDIGERNVIGFGGYPVYINANDNNTVAGNYIGFTADGATQVGAGWLLIRQHSSDNVIGTDGDGVSDELERNYFGNDYSINYQGFAVRGANNKIAGNTFGLGPDGASAPISEGIRMTGLEAVNIGVEITDNTIVTSSTGVALSIRGEASGAGVLVDGNSFGLLDGSFPQNDHGIILHGSGSSVVSNNVITGSYTEGLTIRDDATLGPASDGNCIVRNDHGMANNSSFAMVFEDNWWNYIGGPWDGVPNPGDSVSGDVDFTPWLTNPPAICNTQPVADDATFSINAGAPAGAAVGTATATDDGSDLTFAITAGDPAGVFDIGSATGEIVKQGTPDYPATTSYALTIEATDSSSLSDTGTVTVDITNQAPVAVDNAFTIAEDLAIGGAVGEVAATDGDGDLLDFVITAGDPDGDFAIDSDGAITVAAPLDYETTPSYSLTVSATDGFEADTAAVTVTVTDVNETPTTPTFDDVPAGHTFFAAIEWLAAEGITRGCNPPGNDLFCPDGSVTRGQMAAFLHRALGGTLTAGSLPDFNDAAGSIFEADIEWLGAVGVTRGCNPPVNDQFCPDAVVTRQQMAAFLVRALGYTAGAGSDAFADDDGSLFEADIERLAEAGITKGCNPPINDLFCPTAAVTRAQMAAFLHRALVP